MNTNKTIALIAAVLVLASLQKKTATNLNQNQKAVTANPGQLTRNPLDGQRYYYYDPSAYGYDPGISGDNLYGDPTVSSAASQQWNVATGDGANAADPNFIGTTDAGNPIKFQF